MQALDIGFGTGFPLTELAMRLEKIQTNLYAPLFDMEFSCIYGHVFQRFSAVSPASILGGNLIGLKSAIPYEIKQSRWQQA